MEGDSSIFAYMPEVRGALVTLSVGFQFWTPPYGTLLTELPYIGVGSVLGWAFFYKTLLLKDRIVYFFTCFILSESIGLYILRG